MNPSVEKVFTNIDIVENIFKYFCFKEQLKLTSVCDQFKEIIVNFIWNSLYQGLRFDEFDNGVLVYNKIGDERRHQTEYDINCMPIQNTELNLKTDRFVYLFYGKCKQFLRMIGNKVEKLEITKTSKIRYVEWIFDQHFEQLTFLCCNLFKSYLKDIRVSCPQLETLIIRDGRYEKDYNGVLADIEEFSKMKMLKHLEIIDDLSYRTYDYEDIKTMLNKLQLLQIKIKVSIGIKSTTNYDGNLATSKDKVPNLCQKLHISTFKQFPILSDTCESFLTDFTNLSQLTISIATSLDNNFCNVLTESCKKLINLKLEKCKFTHFMPIPSLKILTLQQCDCLTWITLKEILNEMNLLTFISIDTNYSEPFENFYMSPTLQYLHLENKYWSHSLSELFQYNSKNVENLKTLNVHVKNNMRNLRIPLKEKFENLQTLEIDLNLTTYEDLLEMKTLQKLKQIHGTGTIEWTYLLQLLKHPTIKYLILDTNQLTNTNAHPIKYLLDNSYKTNILHIEVTLQIFRDYQNFWYELLARNSKLKIRVCHFSCYQIQRDFNAKLLFNGTNFPKRIKYIIWLGYKVECENFNENFEVIMKKIKFAEDYKPVHKHDMYILF